MHSTAVISKGCVWLDGMERPQRRQLCAVVLASVLVQLPQIAATCCCSLARGNCLASRAAVQTGLLFCCSFLIVDVIDDRQALLFAWSGERKLGPLESTAAASTLSLAAAVALLLLFSKACLLAAWICICDDARGGVLPAS